MNRLLQATILISLRIINLKIILKKFTIKNNKIGILFLLNINENKKLKKKVCILE